MPMKAITAINTVFLHSFGMGLNGDPESVQNLV